MSAALMNGEVSRTADALVEELQLRIVPSEEIPESALELTVPISLSEAQILRGIWGNGTGFGLRYCADAVATRPDAQHIIFWRLQPLSSLSLERRAMKAFRGVNTKR
jgi:hypothetical protein